MKSSLLGFCILALSLLLEAEVRAQTTFVETGFGLPNTIPFGTSLADFNGDGKLDVLCFDGTPTNFLATIYQNTSGVAFARVLPAWPGNTRGVTQSFWADDNGDGLLDLIMTGEDDSRQEVVRVYWQNSDHIFSEHPVNLTGSVSGWRDLDNDGRVDIITGDAVRWKEADGSYTLAIVAPSVGIWDAADLDGDGDLDLITTDGIILRNDGNRSIVNTGVRLFFPIAVADMDGDGRLDVISNQADIVNGVQTFSLSLPVIFYNQGSFNFRSNAIPTGAHYYKAGAVGDLTADNKTDLLINSTQFGIGFPPVTFVNTNGDFLQNKFSFSINGSGAATVMLGDFDGDGDLDVLGLENEGKRRLFRNMSNLTRPVAPPKNLRSEPNRDRINLAWDGDSTNGATSFNIRIGTAPGLSDVVSAESLPSGQRMFPKMGNAQTSGTWHISKLKPGVYFWSVQAVDWAFRGSAFADEQTFTITEPGPLPPKPTISSIQNVFTDEDTAAEVSFTIGPEDRLLDFELTVASSVAPLAPASNLQISGEGTNRTLRILPGTNQSGIATLTVRVTDSAGQQASSSFVLSVFPVNDAPVLSEFSNKVVYNNSGSLTIPYYAGDAETTFFSRVKLSATSSDTNFLPNSAITFGSDFRVTTTNLVIETPTNKVGSVTIKLTADDGELQTTSSFVLLVLPAQLQETGSPLTSETVNGVTWADFNNDGRLDLLANFGGGPQMFLNTPGGFVPGFFAFPANGLGGFSVVDLNRDNYLDVVMVSPDAVRIYLNQGGTNFVSAPVGAIPKAQFPTLDFADVDNDGDLDVFISGSNSAGSFLRRLLISDAGVFRLVSAPLGAISGILAFADFDGDGWIDIAFGGSTTAGVATNGMYRGIGAGQFQLVSGIFASMPDTFAGPLDINADGQPDLLRAAGRSVVSFINDHGVFHSITNSFDFTVSVTAWGDFDGDGLLDLVGIGTAASSSYQSVIFKNRGEEGFTAALNPIPSAMIPISVGDMNNDGAIDLLAGARPDYRGLRAYTNLSRALNAPPGTPRNLAATVSSNGMVLSWTAPDDVNQFGGFTYNVRVGTRRGGSDVVSASALANGKRLLVGAGNAGGRFSLIVTNLTSEAYYWSVQAIDNSFAGGPFAEEEIVRVAVPGNLPPTAVADPPAYIGGEDKAGTFTITVGDDRTLPEDLKVRAFALDPGLIPFTNFTISGTSATRTIQFRPLTNGFGETQIEIQTTDSGGLIGSTLVSVTITNIDDAPKISSIPNQFSNGPGDPVTATFSISDLDDLPEMLTLTVGSSDLVTLPIENISLGGSGTNRTITLFTTSPVPTNVDVTIRVTDPSGLSATSGLSVAFTNRVFKLSEGAFPAGRSGPMAWGDVDDDGDLDLVISGDGVANAAVYVNDGRGVFTKSPVVLLPSPSVPAWLDIDSDGDLDLLLSGGFVLMQNQGAGDLQRVVSGLPDGTGIFADFDNDGDVDLATTANTPSGFPRAFVLENRLGEFVQQPSVFSLADCYPIAFEDYNNDGWLDLRVARFGGGIWSESVFTQHSGVFVETPPMWTGELALWADFDNDGLPDAIVDTNPSVSTDDLAFVRNEGSKFSYPPAVILSHFLARDLSAGDFDNDGYLDLLVVGNSSSDGGAYQIKLLHNEHNGTFREVQHPLPTFSSLHFSWADVDNDGDLDLTFSGQPAVAGAGYVTWLFKNNQQTPNVPPTAPTGLHADYSSEGLRIEWNESTDLNQDGGLTYNVAVGTQPGKWDVISPMSHPDGRRKVVEKGNAGWRLSKTVRGLTSGQHYYFTVQAVDNSFAGSAFAPVQSIFATALPQLNAPVLVDGMLQFTLLAQPGGFYVLESSTDLKTWTGVISIDNIPTHVQVPLLGTEMRFFRIRAP